jgi:hypothetical protein
MSSSGQTGRFNRRGRLDEKDQSSSDVVKVGVSGTVMCASSYKIGKSGGLVRVRFDKGVDRLIFGAHKGTKEG